MAMQNVTHIIVRRDSLSVPTVIENAKAEAVAPATAL